MANTVAAPPKNEIADIPKPKPLRKQAPRRLFVDYGDPDLKVVVRLLPPTLSEHDFLQQVTQKLPPLVSPYQHFYYEAGTRKVKPFEEPIYSRAYFQFLSQQAAVAFTKAVQGVSFEEPETGDQFMCQTMRSIFGAVGTPSETSAPFDILTIPLYSLYLAAREEKGNAVNLAEIQQALVAAANKAKKRQEKLKLKKKAKKDANKEVKKQAKKQKGPKTEPKPEKPESQKKELRKTDTQAPEPQKSSTAQSEEPVGSEDPGAAKKKKKPKKPKKPKTPKAEGAEGAAKAEGAPESGPVNPQKPKKRRNKNGNKAQQDLWPKLEGAPSKETKDG